MKLAIIALLFASVSLTFAKELTLSVEKITYKGNKYGSSEAFEVQCSNLSSNLSYLPQADRLELCFYQENIIVEQDADNITLFSPLLNNIKFGFQSEINLQKTNGQFEYKYQNQAAPFAWSYKVSHTIRQISTSKWIYTIVEEGGINAWGYPVFVDSSIYKLTVK